jgi:transposase-like protein
LWSRAGLGHDGRAIVSVAVIIAVGVNSDGRREVLDVGIDPSEAETFCATDALQDSY